MNVELATDGGGINTTHMVAFQEETEHTSLLYTHANVKRMKSRRLKIENVNFGRLAINIKHEPPVFSQTDELQIHEVVNPYCMGGTFSYAKKVIVNLERQLDVTFHRLLPKRRTLR